MTPGVDTLGMVFLGHLCGAIVRVAVPTVVGVSETRIVALLVVGVPGHLTMTLARDMELRIQGHLREIGDVNDEAIGSRQGFPPAVDAYEKTLTSVAGCATVDEVDEVAAYIKDRIRGSEERPANQSVRRTARTIVSRAGYPADDFLNAA